MRIVVTGGVGFIGTHLVTALLREDHHVAALDNFFTGGMPRRFESNVAIAGVQHLVRHDVCEPFHIECDILYHLACPASPIHYQRNPARTLETAFMGTLNALRCARECGARFVLASTSEVYGDPAEHPQTETYWGHVDPQGKRACYEEGKRAAEAIAVSYAQQFDVDVRIARIFNTYGPLMSGTDGRVIPNLIMQALRGHPLTVYGDGTQTRSFCFVSDMVDALMRLGNVKRYLPSVTMNLGNPVEVTMLELATRILETCGGDPEHFIFAPLPEGDPKRRRPHIGRARAVLGWEPRVSLSDGLAKTVAWFREAYGSSPIAA